MDIRKEVLKAHSKPQTDKIVKYVGKNPERFKDLITNFLQGDYRVTQRIAWPLSYCVCNHPELIKPYLQKTLTMLDKPGIHDAVKRNIMRLLQFVEIPKRLQGIAADKAFQLMDPREPIAVRVFSMTVLKNLALQEPDLKKELKLIIEDQLPYGTAAYQSRAKKVLKELAK
jgi:hypothetical protein